MRIKLTRPLAVFDIEATGTSPRADRIVELAVVKVLADRSRQSRTWRVNPEMPIPAEATRIHGITDADIAAAPKFREIAAEVLDFLQDCDLCGYNVLRFDIPLLAEECIRAGVNLGIESRRVVDVQRIFHRREPRDLTAALAFYCGELHLDAHGAEADVLATLRVLDGQYQRYSDLPVTVEDLDAYCNPRHPEWADKTGRLKWQNNEIVLNFGKKKGVSLRTLVRDDTDFIRWMLRSDFPRDTREIIEKAVAGQWPQPPKDQPGEED